MSNNSWRKVIIGITFLILTLFYTAIFMNNASMTNELFFNIAHIKSLSNIFVSPINFDYWGHTGSLINFYSPWLTILPGILFLNQNVIIGFLIIFAIITYFTLISSYYYMKKFSNDTLEALLFSVIYTLSFNRFFLIFNEQRLENYLVLIFLPMVYYGIFQFFSSKSKDWFTLTLGMVLIIWTSPYMALAVTLTFIPILPLMIFSKISHHWNYWGRVLLNLLKMIVSTVLLTIGYWGPLLENQWSKGFLYRRHSQFDYWSWFNKNFLNQSNQYLFLISVILLGLVLIVIFLKSTFSYKILILESLILTIWLIFQPKLAIDTSQLMFSMTSIVDSFLIVIVIRILLLLFQERSAILRLLILLSVVIGFSYLTYTWVTQIHSQNKIEVTKKIDYKNIFNHDEDSKNKNHFLIDDRSTRIQFETKDNEYWLQYYNPESVLMDIPIQNYPGYKITVNNEKPKLLKSQRGTVLLQTDPDKNIIEIRSHYTNLAIISLLINLFAFIAFGYVYGKFKFKTNKKK